MNQHPDIPERIARKIVMDCADCDCCRPILDESCLFFPELYRLYDREAETGAKPTSAELRALVDRCNFCALCPCPNIRADIIRAKTAFAGRDGLPFGVRRLEDVARIGRICGALPALTNRLLGSRPAGGLIRRALGVHPDRRLPRFPPESFPAWARRRGLNRRPAGSTGRRVVYFAGCTASFIFPEVARATVEVLEACGAAVFCPDLRCCGMPSFLEGDRDFTIQAAAHNLPLLAGLAREGFDILCSCPTCSFMLRGLMAEGAYYSEDYQRAAGGDARTIRVPARAKPGEEAAARPAERFDRTIYGKIMRDDGYFSSLDPMQRVALAERTFDAGEYLAALRRRGGLEARFGRIRSQAIYFPPCHQREQEFGQPYLELLQEGLGMTIAALPGSLQCCGLAGVMGFKRGFHEASLRLGSRLMEKIRALAPELLVTDCLSCRLQFNQALPVTVRHPMELLREALSPAAARG